MKRLPKTSVAALVEFRKMALVAGPSSPESPEVPLPAIVVMRPFGK